MNVTPDPYVMTPIPVPPFQDQQDEAAAMAAVVATVTHRVLGYWPSAQAVREVTDLLLADRVAGT